MKTLRRAIFTVTAFVLSTTAAIATPVEPLVDPVEQSAGLARNNDPQGALAILQKSAAMNSQDWLTQASLSYHSWQLGDNASAIRAGLEAVKLNPRSTVALTNLARMEEALGAQRDALILYEKLSKLDAQNPVGGIGQARCYITTDNRERALAILKGMTQINRDNFGWNYQVAQMLLQINESSAASATALQALYCAKNKEEEAKAKTQLLLALVLNNQTNEANAIALDVFDHCQPTRHEVFVRTASKLCKVSQPELAERIMLSALRNLNGPDDAEGFYKLGRVFQNKAAYVSFDATKYSKWQQLAQQAYEAALVRDKMQARYYQALAGVLEQQKRHASAVEQLQTAHKLDPFDTLTCRLLTSAQEQKPFNIAKIRFSTKGVTCTCHFAKIEQELAKGTGVAFASISRVEPFEGTLLLSESGAAEAVLQKCKSNLTGGPETKLFNDMQFAVLSREPIYGAEEAVRVAQNATVGDPLLYFDFLAVTPPVMPTGADRGMKAIATK